MKELWYRQPASSEVETLPLGCGSLGAMVWGDPVDERIALNHELLWSGTGSTDPKESRNLSEELRTVRSLLRDEVYREAEHLLEQHFLGEYTESYMPAGDLRIRLLSAEGEYGTYRRSLDLEEAIAYVDTDIALPGGRETHLHREMFTSFPEKTFFLRQTSTEAVDCSITLESPERLLNVIPLENRGMQWKLQLPEHVDPSYLGPKENAILWGDRGICYTVTARILQCDGWAQGTLTPCYDLIPFFLTNDKNSGAEDLQEDLEDYTPEASLEIRGAKEWVLALSIQVEDPASRTEADACVEGRLDPCEDGSASAWAGNSFDSCPKANAEDGAHVRSSLAVGPEAFKAGDMLQIDWSFDQHKEAHVRDYRALYDRADLELPSCKDDLPTDERLKDPDPGLYAIYFQYGRYLLIASSREGGLPANLQGIWSWEMRAPWSANYTVNINLQMNYWPALVCNLEECDRVYIDFIKRICEKGRKTAAAFGCRGSACGHNSDGWGHTYPVGVTRGEEAGEPHCLMWAYYLMAQVWMDQEVWRRYEYHPEPSYLTETVYPLLKASVEFVLDYLHLQDGYYVTSPASTPENTFLDEEGFRVSVSYATTMDMTLVRELFAEFRRTVSALGKAGAPELMREGLQYLEMMDRVEPLLYPVQFNPDGSVCEWFRPRSEAEKGHRHVSHLYGLFPSNLWRGDADMHRAVAKSLENRMKAGSGHTGWSLAWITNLYTILGDADAVQRCLVQMLERSTYPNLWDKHPPFQIDGNFGMTAAIAHMLVKEQEEPELLPCLPPAWRDGSVRGLRLPGGKEISFAWKDGKVLKDTVKVETQ
ncbi:MAG: glycoside hydrolase family 95 protein [Lachnospiraceae bacterium]|nr:glycoside hydrolase family 95 protein [Lachnospiraceae bacterium]